MLTKIQHIYKKNMCCVLTVCPASYIETAAFKKIRNIRRFYFYILTSNHSTISPSMAIAIFTIFLAQMRTKPTLERVQRHMSDYQKLLLRAQSALIYRSYADHCILGDCFHAGGYFFVLYNNYLIS